MGRKKIEIKPLTDERNRNVTFLKRKAGLMKKAYELSVLCGVSVNILIFGSNGKPYEFSSAEFDEEVDKYNEYEGAIERRRAAEFEAMALAGEDDDDEDDAPSAPGKKPGPGKSLKGKESFKARRVLGRERERDRRRSSRADVKEESFVGGIVFDDDEDDRALSPPPRPDSPSASLAYALNMHSSQHAPPPPPPVAPWNAYRPPNYSNGPPFLPTPGQGWDQSMLTTYAWLQIQQAHQEQKRQLLEKQQHQLLELTSRSGGHAFLRDMLSVGVGGGGASGVSAPGSAWSEPEFVWPTAQGHDAQQSSNGAPSTPPDDSLFWALSGAGAQSAGPSNGYRDRERLEDPRAPKRVR